MVAGDRVLPQCLGISTAITTASLCRCPQLHAAVYECRACQVGIGCMGLSAACRALYIHRRPPHLLQHGLTTHCMALAVSSRRLICGQACTRPHPALGPAQHHHQAGTGQHAHLQQPASRAAQHGQQAGPGFRRGQQPAPRPVILAGRQTSFWLRQGCARKPLNLIHQLYTLKPESAAQPAAEGAGLALALRAVVAGAAVAGPGGPLLHRHQPLPGAVPGHCLGHRARCAA